LEEEIFFGDADGDDYKSKFNGQTQASGKPPGTARTSSAHLEAENYDHILAFGGPGSMPPPFNAHATTYPAVTTQDVSSSGMYMCIYKCIAPTSQKIARFKGATKTVKNGKSRGFPSCQSSFASKSHDRPQCVGYRACCGAPLSGSGSLWTYEWDDRHAAINKL